ncbi:hypothetical protein COE15_14605 [Bacillus cereus]|nr:hypothetical protein COE15_14605 [Bacillus cereus]
MREIKFRAWDLGAESMVDWESIKLHFSEHIDHEMVVVMQYTGLKDVHGEEIYEGDILRISSNFELRKDVQNQAVEYREGYFHTFEWTLFELLRNKKVEKQTFEVIGNIYENPELLKGDGENEGD